MAGEAGIGLDPTALIGEGLGAIQSAVGVVQAIKAKKAQKKLLAQRKTFQTPDEIFDILNATQANAQSGFDPVTLNYLTNQTDQAFSGSIGAAERLGADANDLSAIFNEKVNSIMQIGSQNHQLNMANFSAYLGALDTVAANKAAEQKSKEDLLRDKLQAEGLNLQAATGNIAGGINTGLAALSASQIGNLFNPDGTLKTNDTSGGLNPFTKRVTTKVY